MLIANPMFGCKLMVTRDEPTSAKQNDRPCSQICSLNCYSPESGHLHYGVLTGGNFQLSINFNIHARDSWLQKFAKTQVK
jgi:hypothetical protein